LSGYKFSESLSTQCSFSTFSYNEINKQPEHFLERYVDSHYMENLE